MCVLLLPCVAARTTDEVIITRQLTMAQRKSLPDKTVEMDVKRLASSKDCDVRLVNALSLLLDSIADADDSNRTFVVILSPHGSDGTIAVAVHSDDILTKAEHRTSAYGDLERGGRHFVLLADDANRQLLKRNFKQHGGKVKFVQEFEFVSFPTPRYPTSVIGTWQPSGKLMLQSFVINDGDPSRQDGDAAPASVIEHDAP